MDVEQQALVEATNLTQEQYKEFLDIVEVTPAKRAPINGKTVRLGFELMEDTGLRITELLHVKKRDVDFRTNIITVTHPKSEKKCKCSTWKYKDQYTRTRILEYANPDCNRCHGKGKWKAPQRTTFTPRILSKLFNYCNQLQDDANLFLGHRSTWWRWGKKAGKAAGINIFQQKEEKLIEGIYNHLFRALCSLRTTRDAKDDPYQRQLVDVKMRHHKELQDRYNRVDINYLINWESNTYANL